MSPAGLLGGAGIAFDAKGNIGLYDYAGVPSGLGPAAISLYPFKLRTVLTL